MSIQSEITRIITGVSAAKTAISTKGGTLSSSSVDDLASEIATIPSGEPQKYFSIADQSDNVTAAINPNADIQAWEYFLFRDSVSFYKNVKAAIVSGNEMFGYEEFTSYGTNISAKVTDYDTLVSNYHDYTWNSGTMDFTVIKESGTVTVTLYNIYDGEQVFTLQEFESQFGISVVDTGISNSFYEQVKVWVENFWTYTKEAYAGGSATFYIRQEELQNIGLTLTVTGESENGTYVQVLYD